MPRSSIRERLRWLTRLLVKPLFSAAVPIPLQRSILRASAGLLTRNAAGVHYVSESLDGVAVEWVQGNHGAADDAAVILYLHGGGYCIGSPLSYRPVTSRLALLTGLRVAAPDYRLAPEYPHPAALQDAVAAYRALMRSGSAHIVLAGDSAGAGLALALSVALKQSHLPSPSALLLVSPFVDLTGTSPSFRGKRAADPMLSPAGLLRWGRAYLGAAAPDHPPCSPLFADLSSLPPTQIHVGTEEVLLDDSLRLAQKLRQAGVTTELHVAEGLWHDYPVHAGLLPEADQALERMARFARQHVAQAPPVGRVPADQPLGRAHP